MNMNSNLRASMNSKHFFNFLLNFHAVRLSVQWWTLECQYVTYFYISTLPAANMDEYITGSYISRLIWTTVWYIARVAI